MNAKKFADENGKTAWLTNDVHSAAVETINESLDFNTGFTREEKNIMWIKGNSAEAVAKQVDNVVKAVNSGKLATYRAFSTEPFYANQTPDINPQTQAPVVPTRYSQVRLCPAAKFEELNRNFVTTAPVVAQAPIAADA